MTDPSQFYDYRAAMNRSPLVNAIRARHTIRILPRVFVAKRHGQWWVTRHRDSTLGVPFDTLPEAHDFACDMWTTSARSRP